MNDEIGYPWGMVSGHAELADALFLAAFVLAAVGAALLLAARAVPAMLTTAAVALIALAWFVL